MSEAKLSSQMVGKFGIEIAAPCNRQVQFVLTMDVLRGRYDSAYNSGMSASDGMGALQRAFPIIRGECLEVDTTKRQARIFDPYAAGEVDGDKWERLGQLINGVPLVGKLNMGPRKAVVAKELDADRLKEWMFICRKFIDTDKAIQLSGEGYRAWPSMDEIKKMPGKVRRNFFQAAIDGEIQYQYEVPVGA